MVALLGQLKLGLAEESEAQHLADRRTDHRDGLRVWCHVLAIAGLVGLRFTSLALTADVTVVAYAVLTKGWLLMSMLVGWVDETIDPPMLFD